jgi:hypothetical protein
MTMAALKPINAKMTFRIDTGETKDDRTVFSSVSLLNVKGNPDPDNLAVVSESIKGLLDGKTDVVSLIRTDAIEL